MRNVTQYGLLPSNDDIRDGDAVCHQLPSMLQMFLQSIVKSTMKRAANGQCLLRAARTRSMIPPLLFGLGVELDYTFGSKWLINKPFQDTPFPAMKLQGSNRIPLSRQTLKTSSQSTQAV